MENCRKVDKSVQIQKIDGGKYIVFCPSADTSFEIGQKEHAVLCLLNGTNTVSQIQKECSFFTAEEIEALIHAFDEIDLLEKPRIKKKKRNILKIKMMLFCPNRLFQPESLFVKLYSSFIIYGSIPIFLFGCVVFNLNSQNKALANSILFHSNDLFRFILYILVFSLISLVLHELSHAVVGRRYNTSVAEIGVMLYLFIPVAYTNINGLQSLGNKKQKLRILCAGCLTNLLLCGIGHIVVSFAASEFFIRLMVLFVFSNYFLIALNCLIFIKYDAYYVWQVIMEEAFLREHCFSFLFSLIRKKRIQRVQKCSIIASDTFDRNCFFLSYSILSALLVPVLLANTIVSVFR